jgi:hypothetical protein
MAWELIGERDEGTVIGSSGLGVWIGTAGAAGGPPARFTSAGADQGDNGGVLRGVLHCLPPGDGLARLTLNLTLQGLRTARANP